MAASVVALLVVVALVVALVVELRLRRRCACSALRRMLSSLLLAPLAAPYRLCSFTCGEKDEAEAWKACRSEKCTSSQLPEDLCADGSEPTEASADGLGLALSSPLDCAAHDVPHAGSFAERCDLCVGLTQAAVDLRRRELSSSELEALGAAGLCARASATLADTLPTVRTCRLDGDGCRALVASFENSTCARAWEQLAAGASSSTVVYAAREQCGAMLTARAGSKVDAATVCPAQRDVGTRVFAIAAAVAATLLAAQLSGAG